MQALRVSVAVVLLCFMGTTGCMSSLRLKNQALSHVTGQASSIPDIYIQEVLNNLAMIEDNPARMPYFSDPQTSRTSIQQTGSASYGAFADLISVRRSQTL